MQGVFPIHPHTQSFGSFPVWNSLDILEYCDQVQHGQCALGVLIPTEWIIQIKTKEQLIDVVPDGEVKIAAGKHKSGCNVRIRRDGWKEI
jgi:hypothetical protein